MKVKVSYNWRWIWFGIGIYTQVKAVDVHLPFCLVVIKWGDSNA